MAEQVEKNMELIMSEVEMMARTKLFSMEETREIIKKRRKFEYDLAKPTKTLHDYKNYIQHETNILRLVELRRNKQKISEKKQDIDYQIRKRIHKLYDTAIQRFADDDVLCLSYFKFAKLRNMTAAADSVVLTLMKRHSMKQQIWQLAAKWYAYDKNDIQLALQTLDKGRAIHKDSGLLYMESIQLELFKVIGRRSGPKEEVNDLNEKKSACVARLLLYLQDMFINITDCKFYIELLKFLEKQTFTNDVQVKIAEHMLQRFTDEPLMWHSLALREWGGHHLVAQDTSSTRTRLTLSNTKYYEGIEHLSSDDKREELWKLFLDFLIELMQDNLGSAKQFKKNCYMEACEKASKSTFLAENHYIKWLELVENQTDRGAILRRATETLPYSVELWKMRLQHLFSTLATEEEKCHIEEVFRLGVSYLKEKALPIWVALLRYKVLYSTDEEIEALFQEGTLQPEQVSSFLKPQYLEWLTISKNISKARETYKRLALEKPYCKKLHFMMSNLESCEIKENFGEWESVHKLACEQFGTKDEDVWINYIDFCVNYSKKDKKENVLEFVREIQKEAETKLPAPALIDFRDKFSKINLDRLNPQTTI